MHFKLPIGYLYSFILSDMVELQNCSSPILKSWDGRPSPSQLFKDSYVQYNQTVNQEVNQE